MLLLFLFLGCGFTWVLNCFWYMPIWPFGFCLKLLYICRHRCHWNQNFGFFFLDGIENKWIKDFSLFCFSFKNQDCVYGLLIKIQILIFFSDKKLNGYSLLCVLLDGHIGIRKRWNKRIFTIVSMWNFPIQHGLCWFKEI